MKREPYKGAEHVFWVVDNGSWHRGAAAARRLAQAYATLIVGHTPVHARWLNQVEIYFSSVHRKVLTPNDFASLAEVEHRLSLSEALSNPHPHPCEGKFTRAKLVDFLHRLEAHARRIAPPQAPPNNSAMNQETLLAA